MDRKIWNGVDISNIESLYDLFKIMNKDYNGIALDFFGKKYTYNDFFRKIDELTSIIIHLGIKNNDVVLFNMITSPESICLTFALNRIGAIIYFSDVRSDEKTIIREYEKCQCRFAFIHKLGFFNIDKVAAHFPNVKTIIVYPQQTFFETKIGFMTYKTFSVFRKLNGKIHHRNQAVNLLDLQHKKYPINDIAALPRENNKTIAIFTTGGTTGLPKCVMYKMNSIYSSMFIFEKDFYYNHQRGDITLSVLPINIFYGFGASILSPLVRGGEIVIAPNPYRINLLRLIKKYKPAFVFGVPYYLKDIIANKRNVDCSSFKQLVISSEKMSQKNVDLVNDYLKKNHSSISLTSLYGTTELNYIAKSGGGDSLFSISDNVKLKLFPTNDGDKQEICVHSNWTDDFEYYKENSDSLFNIDENHVKYIRTGDVGKLIDGKLLLEGRNKRFILTAYGYKIYAFEIEDIVRQIDFIKEVVAFPIPDKKSHYNCVPAVAVTIKTNKYNKHQLLLQINKVLADNLSPYKRPEKIFVLKEMPRTQRNKIDFLSLEKKYS